MPKRRICVLVVDNDEPVRSFIARAFAADAEVVEASDLEQALRQLGAGGGQRFDLAVVECLLAGGYGPAGGIELLERIRTEWPLTPVIAITGGSDLEWLIVEAFRRGARDFLKKPFSIEALTMALTRVMPWRLPQGPARRRRDPTLAINPILAFIGEHYTEPLSVTQLAETIGLTHSQFRRVFRAVVGSPLRDHLRDVRLARAQHLLSTSPLSVTDIALETGFYDLPHLDKTFRKRFDISPSEFRRRRWVTGLPGTGVAPGEAREDQNTRTEALRHRGVPALRTEQL